MKKRLISIVFITSFIIFSFINGHGHDRKDDSVHGRLKELEKYQKVLKRVISLKKNKLAQLSLESGEILYTIHQEKNTLKFLIPENGILDTAIGIDPMIKEIFTGSVFFELYLTLDNEELYKIFEKEIDLFKSSREKFDWETIELDLSKYSGKEVTLYFKKGYKEDFQIRAAKIYDLLPIDFMFWRKPYIRPKRLKGKHNVILISLDTVRIDHLSFMGYNRKTSPNLDKLAENGVYFITVISQAPWTTPSHFSIFTSTYPSVHKGNQPINISKRYWKYTLPTVAGILRDEGYLTGAFTGSAAISAKFGFYKGFDFYNETDMGYNKSDAKKIFNKSIKWINNNKERSFFLFIHTYEPHAPYTNNFFVNQERISQKRVLKYRTALYDGDIKTADFFVGKLMNELDRLGLTDNTIVIITSDHGEDLGGRNPPEAKIQYGHGHNLYDELLLVPLIFYCPNIFTKGKRIDFQVRLIDILPTLLDYLDIKKRRTFQGKSLKRMIEGHDKKSRPAYSEATTYGPEREAMRYNGYKYIHRISYGQLADSSSFGMILTPIHEFYDLRNDPVEKMNIYDTNKKIAEEYQKIIHSISLDKAFKKGNKEDGAAEGINIINIGEDKELMERLRSLGYIQY